jgi:hypothetical protein
MGGGIVRNADPEAAFNSISGGRDVVNRADLTIPWMQGVFDRIASQMRITTGQITRDQYRTFMQLRMARRGGGAPAAVAPQAPQGGGGMGNRNDTWDTWAENFFRRADANGDGFLNSDEMTPDLRSELAKWDTDRNGLIDLNEYKAYFRARMQQAMTDRNAAGFNQASPNQFTPSSEPAAPAEEEDSRPIVYHTTNLPKELPSWFRELDTDQDAQIGLYEWKASKRPIEEFLQMDRNNDGFLTVEEVLYYQKKNQIPPNGAEVAGGPLPGNGGGFGQGFAPPAGFRGPGNGGGFQQFQSPAPGAPQIGIGRPNRGNQQAGGPRRGNGRRQFGPRGNQ